MSSCILVKRMVCGRPPAAKLASQLLLCILLTSGSGLAGAQQSNPKDPQQTTPAPLPATSPQQTQGAHKKSEEEKEIEKREQSQRVLGVIPEFGVTSRQDAPPLSRHEKFHLFITEAIDPGMIGVVGLQAGLSQAENEFPAYRQGAIGYGKRFGASLADEISAGFFSSYSYPVLLKEDPRYFRLGEGSVGHRALYSVKQEFVCHTDKGGHVFAFSNVLGAFTSGAISNLYYPGTTLIRTIPATSTSPAIPVYEDDRGVVLTLSRSAIALGYGTIGALFDEFWPDIHDRMLRKHKSDRQLLLAH